MMRWVTRFFAGIAIVVFASVLCAPQASAYLLPGASGSARWDDSEGQPDLLWKDEFFKKYAPDNGEAYDDSNSKPDSVRLRLDPASRNPYRLYAEDIYIKVPDVAEKIDGTVIDCVITKFAVDVDIDTTPNKILKAEVLEVHVEARDGAMAGITNFINEALNQCRDAMNGDSNAATTNDPVVGFKNVRADIDNTFGQDANLSAVLDILANIYPTESTRFGDRICSTHSRTSPTAEREECRKEALSYYKKVWTLCRENAMTTGSANERVNKVKECLQEKSGVSIIAGSLLDSANYNEITFRDKESCSIRYIGWIICPMMRFLGDVTDTAFKYLQTFFEIQPLNRGSPAGDALYRGWQLMSSLANVIFIIVFLFIIFSQVTGRGIEKYGIKPLLPKMIVVAILVNASYFLCVVAVDISSIIGNGVFELLRLVEPEVEHQVSTWGKEVEKSLIFTGAAVGVGLVALTVSLVALVPLLVGAALSFIVALIIIIARYAIILVLIIVAPVAIACQLLPGAEKWWQQWKKVFISMLMLYPLVALVFGGAQIAALIILNSSVSRGGASEVTLQVIALAVQALPLAITPVLMTVSGGMLSGIGSKVSSSKLFGKARQGSRDYAQNKKNARDVKALRATGANKRRGLPGLRDKVIQGRYRRKAKRSAIDQGYHEAHAKYISGYASGAAGYGGEKKSLSGRLTGSGETKAESFANSLARGGGSADVVRSDALKMQLAVSNKVIKVEKDNLKSRSDMEYITKLAEGEVTAASDEVRQAAIELVLEEGSLQQVNSVVKATAGMSNSHRQVVARGVASSRVAGKAGFYGTSAAQDAILSGKVGSDAEFTSNIVNPWVANGRASAENVGSMDAAGLSELHKAMDDMDQELANVVSDAAKAAQASGSISSQTHAGSAQVRRRGGNGTEYYENATAAEILDEIANR